MVEKKKDTRRKKSDILEDVAKVNAKIAEGMSPTAACEEVNLNYQTYKRYAEPTTSTTDDLSELGKAMADYKKAVERLRGLGVHVPNVKLRVDLAV